MTTPILELKELHVSIASKQILKGISLKILPGEVHAIMGPNGSGKTTLAKAIAGHPDYKITQGDILFKGQSIKNLKSDERARLGLFLAFQHPTEISGVGLSHYLYTIWHARKHEGASPLEFQKALNAACETLAIDTSFMQRDLNAGLSGGEKKRAEILQMLLLNPAFALLDEIDSGLDIDSLQAVAKAIANLRDSVFSCLVVTHYQRILNHLKPDIVHVLMDGKIVATGTYELAQKLEKKGYAWLNKNDASLLQVA